MRITTLIGQGLSAAAVLLFALPAGAQNFRVQCPTSTNLHAALTKAQSDALAAGADTIPGGTIKCQEISGGDGYATMGDGTQTYLFGFGPLSGLDLIAAGKPGTLPAAAFNGRFNAPFVDYLGGATYTDTVYDSALPTNRDAAITDPPDIMNMGVLAAQAPAPLMAIDEDDEFFLTLSNVGMIMRPALFEQHTVHFHGYPQASSYFDGVPDASVAIAISGSMTYYYTAPEAGTYFWHCHITPPEHLQMGMEGQLYVRPRQNTVTVGQAVLPLLQAHSCNALTNAAGTIVNSDGFGCSTPGPAVDTAWAQMVNGAGQPYK